MFASSVGTKLLIGFTGLLLFAYLVLHLAGNLMILGGPEGGGPMVVKLTDFGIARAAEQTRITQVGSVVGTAAYLAPEQVRGEEATPASDVYALGVVLYQFLTGRLPYEGSSLAELAVRQQNEKPLAPRTYNEAVPEGLSAAVLRALEGDVNRRYQSAEEFARNLELGYQGEELTEPLTAGDDATTVLGGDTATQHMDRTGQTEYRPAPPPPPRRRAVPAAAPAPRPVAAARPKRSGFSRFVRGVLALVLLVLIAAAVAGIVILTTSDEAGVRLKEIAGDSASEILDQVKSLISDNTQ